MKESYLNTYLSLFSSKYFSSELEYQLRKKEKISCLLINLGMNIKLLSLRIAHDKNINGNSHYLFYMTKKEKHKNCFWKKFYVNVQINECSIIRRERKRKF